MTPKKYLLLFTIGPVQSFIAQARKTHDLYAGSRILSDLIDFAIKKIAERDATVIYPAADTDSKPNRFIAQTQQSDCEAMRTYAQQLAHDVRTEFMRIARECLGGFENWAACENQLDDFLEVHWAAIPYTESDNYGQKYSELEQQLGAAKNFRPFRQIKEWGRKCSVTGKQNALFYRMAKNENKAAYLCQKCIILKHDDERLKDWALQIGEGVSAIVLLKRLYKRNSTASQQSQGEFPSTADIAMLYTLGSLRSKIDNKIDDLARALGETPETIGQFWFAENYNKPYFEQQGKSEQQFKQSLAAWGRVNQCLKLMKQSYHKYYAILLFDADNMGAEIGGSATPCKQNKLSKKLGDYAKWAKCYVEGELYTDKNNAQHVYTQKRGKVVYAGGDDFLGMLTLPTLYETVQMLRQQFDKMVGMTFSAGLAIAHYKTPLSETLQWARKMEKQAKDVDGKDAFAIAAVRHSGQITTTKLKWKIDSDKEDYSDDNMATQSLQIIYEQLRDHFSSKWIRILENESDIFADAAKDSTTEFMFKSELRRLVQRGYDSDDKDKEKARIEQLCHSIEKLLDNIWRVNPPNIQPVIDLLSIADFSNRKINE
jgi:CRISPR-associated protein Cmr2